MNSSFQETENEEDRGKRRSKTRERMGELSHRMDQREKKEEENGGRPDDEEGFEASESHTATPQCKR